MPTRRARFAPSLAACLRAAAFAAVLALAALAPARFAAAASPAAPTAPAADSAGAAPWCAAGKPVRFAGLNWESGAFLTELMRAVMETGYGCRTESIPGNTVAMEAALANNDIQVLAEEWIGRSDVWKEAFNAGKVVALGQVITGAAEGWYVPDYVIHGDPARHIAPMAPALASVADLPKYKALFSDPEEPGKGRFLNCPTGWSCEGVNSQKLKAYGLTGSYVNFRPGTGPALDAAISSDYQRGKPILFYYWSPTPLMGKFKLVRLREPPYNEACFKTLADKNNPKPCGSAAPEAVIQAGVSKAFAQGDPILRGFLDRFNVPLDLLNHTLADMSERKLPARDAARAFLRQHPDIVRAWVGPAIAAQVTAAPAADGIFLSLSIKQAINRGVDRLVAGHGDTFHAVSANLLTWVLVPLESALRATPSWLILAAVALLTWNATRKIVSSVVLSGMLYLIGSFGLWDKLMQTLALMIVATLLTLSIGIPLGIWMARGRLLRRVLLPVLDIMQTLPIFVYLIPVLMLFGLGKVPAILATVVYALPPLIRLTYLGIRQVDRDVAEAAWSLGVTRWQLLTGVQLPLARPSIMAGINQATMMALSMVVIASMIGARGLGEDVLQGIQTLDTGTGLQAGAAIVILAIVIDRISQAYGLTPRQRAALKQARREDR